MKRSEPVSAANTLRFSCYGVRIAVEWDSHIHLSELRSILPPESSELEREEAEHHFSLTALKGTRGEAGPMYLVGGGSSLASSPKCLGSAVASLRKSIHHCIAEHSRDRVFVHAGVATWKGRMIVCPGRSHSGKSTLIWALVNSGAKYYSDEYAVFDNNGHVHPFPVPINLRAPEARGWSVAADRIGTEPARTNLILFAEYRQNGKWDPIVLTPGQTVLRLIQNSLSMRRNPSGVLRVFKTVALTTKAFTGERGEADTVIDWLRLA
jgi:hypothetical protein